MNAAGNRENPYAPPSVEAEVLCGVHVDEHGGMAIEHAKMHSLHHDLGVGDRFFWYSTTGWMMWNYLVSAPIVGAGIVMFDGAPDPAGMWRLAEESGTTYFGTSAPFLMACRSSGVKPMEEADLSRFRGIASTSDSTWENFEGDKEKAAEEVIADETKKPEDDFIQRF